jgi:transposase
MKTLEFKLCLNKTQSQQADSWMSALRWVWNRGLELSNEADQRYKREKHGHPLPTGLKLRYRKGRVTGSGVVRYRGKRPCAPYCEIRQCVEIEDPKKFFASSKYHNNSHVPEWLKDVPASFRTGVHKSLLQALKNARDKNHPAKWPKFKGKRNPIRSLANYNAGGTNRALKPQRGQGDNGYVSFPKMGRIPVKGFWKRFTDEHGYGVARILKEPSGYYLQVAVSLPDVELKASNRAVGIDPGVKAAITTDGGKQYAPANPLKAQARRLKRLQRKASRQWRKNGGVKSNGWLKTQGQIARLHERIRRSRSAFNHKLSTKLVREYGAIAFEETQITNMRRKPKAKPREDGKGYEPNMAKAKAGLNRSLADVAIGDLRQKVKDKVKAHDREFVLVPAHHTSQACNVCGAVDKKNRLSQSEFKCVACGHTENADVNAARNMLTIGKADFARSYRPWGWEVKREESATSPTGGTTGNGETPPLRGMPPEAEQSAPGPEYGPQPLKKRTREQVVADGRKACSLVAGKPLKRRSAQTGGDPGLQTALQDVAPATG